jgi:hypothetical protein
MGIWAKTYAVTEEALSFLFPLKKHRPYGFHDRKGRRIGIDGVVLIPAAVSRAVFHFPPEIDRIPAC